MTRKETGDHHFVVDLAVNKVMAAASRREPRDIVDLLTLHETVLPLGALIWAAVNNAPGYTPEGLIAEIRRNARYPAEELRQLAAEPAIEPDAILRRLRAALDAAEQFVAAMPTEKAGLLFLDADARCSPTHPVSTRTSRTAQDAAVTGLRAPT